MEFYDVVVVGELTADVAFTEHCLHLVILRNMRLLELLEGETSVLDQVGKKGSKLNRFNHLLIVREVLHGDSYRANDDKLPVTDITIFKCVVTDLPASSSHHLPSKLMTT